MLKVLTVSKPTFIFAYKPFNFCNVIFQSSLGINVGQESIGLKKVAHPCPCGNNAVFIKSQTETALFKIK